MRPDLFPNYPEIMTLEEVAQALRISFSTAYQMAQRGSLPAFKVGRLWRFYKSDLVKLLGDSAPITTRPRAVRHGAAIFDALILMHYRYRPHRVKDTPKGGWILMKADDRDNAGPTVKIRFRKIRLTRGTEAIVISSRAVKRIPEKQKDYWEKLRVR